MIPKFFCVTDKQIKLNFIYNNLNFSIKFFSVPNLTSHYRPIKTNKHDLFEEGISRHSIIKQKRVQRER